MCLFSVLPFCDFKYFCFLMYEVLHAAISTNLVLKQKYNVVILYCIIYYIIIRVRSSFSLVASCVLLKYTRTDDVN